MIPKPGQIWKATRGEDGIVVRDLGGERIIADIIQIYKDNVVMILDGQVNARRWGTDDTVLVLFGERIIEVARNCFYNDGGFVLCQQ